jgi:hypothetical protein
MESISDSKFIVKKFQDEAELGIKVHLVLELAPRSEMKRA